MSEYRPGDHVLYTTPATIEAVDDGIVTIRIGDALIATDQEALEMVRKSFHIGDHVVLDGVKGLITQALETDVFLMRIKGATGAGAYRVAGSNDLDHDAPTPAPTPAPAPTSAQAPAPVAPVAPVAPTAPAPAPRADEHQDTLELTDPLPPLEPAAPDAVEAPPERPISAGVAGMVASLAGLAGRTRPSAPGGIESIGRTHEIPAASRDADTPRGDDAA